MNDDNSQRNRWLMWYIMFAVIGIVLARGFWADYQPSEPLPYSAFLQQLFNAGINFFVCFLVLYNHILYCLYVFYFIIFGVSAYKSYV